MRSRNATGAEIVYGHSQHGCGRDKWRILTTSTEQRETPGPGSARGAVGNARDATTET
jgi:hypothetical protein